MIDFDRVSLTYADAERPVLAAVTLHIPEGELCLVVGRTGSGKSTLLGLVNGLVPHFTGGRLAGRVTVDGRDTRTCPPRELADVVGVVGQDPGAGFVTDVVEDELAYTMESIGLAPAVMRRRVEETLDLLGLAEVRDRPLLSLSAGQRQRVAIGAALTSAPRVLVLDEPTSALDPPAAEDVLAVLTRLVHDLGLTVLLAEHRLERVAQYADRLILLPGAGAPLQVGPPAEILASAPVAPPLVGLGRLAGWTPLPLSVRDARRVSGPLRTRLAGLPTPPPAPRAQPPCVPPGHAWPRGPVHRLPPSPASAPLARLRGVIARYPGILALAGVDLDVRGGEVVALMGRNGAGKSTLLACLVGLHPADGVVEVAGEPVWRRPAHEVIRRVGLVPHQPGDLLYADTVAAECAAADRDVGVPAGTTVALLERLAPGIPAGRHPRDLSEGQRLTLALAVVLAGAPPLLLLDEPTRGLDYRAKERLVEILRGLASAGHAVVLATHDVELVAELATRTVIMADGQIVADGPTREIVTASPAFAPQVAKVLSPEPWLTVGDVRRALAG